MSDWTPAKELLVWASEHLSKIPVDGIWSPDDSGVHVCTHVHVQPSGG